MKNTRDTTALIKDLELQIDSLVGYSPTGAHWKMEYHIRSKMIEETLYSDSTPDEVREKINRIQQKLYDLRNGVKNDQPYLEYQEERDVPVYHYKEFERNIKIPTGKKFFGYTDLSKSIASE